MGVARTLPSVAAQPVHLSAAVGIRRASPWCDRSWLQERTYLRRTRRAQAIGEPRAGRHDGARPRVWSGTVAEHRVLSS